MVTINPSRAQVCGLSTYRRMNNLLWQRLPISPMWRNSDRLRIRCCFLNGTAITPSCLRPPQGRPAWAKGLVRHQAFRRYQQPRDGWFLILNGKPFATLGAPPIDEGATTFGRHALEETMGARAFDPAGLVGTFHCSQPFYIRVGNRFKK